MILYTRLLARFLSVIRRKWLSINEVYGDA
jgi:hypothetical protein